MKPSAVKELCEKGILIVEETRSKIKSLKKREVTQEELRSIDMIATNAKIFFINAINAIGTQDAIMIMDNIKLGMDNVYLMETTLKSMGIAYHPVVEIYPYLTSFMYLMGNMAAINSSNNPIRQERSSFDADNTEDLFFRFPSVDNIEKMIKDFFNFGPGGKIHERSEEGKIHKE